MSPSRSGSTLGTMSGGRASKSSAEDVSSATRKVDLAYYEKELIRLQVELVKQQEYIRARGLRSSSSSRAGRRCAQRSAE